MLCHSISDLLGLRSNIDNPAVSACIMKRDFVPLLIIQNDSIKDRAMRRRDSQSRGPSLGQLQHQNDKRSMIEISRPYNIDQLFATAAPEQKSL